MKRTIGIEEPCCWRISIEWWWSEISNNQNHCHEVVTADFDCEQDGFPPDNFLAAPNHLYPSNASAGEELITSYMSAVLNLNLKVGKRFVDELLAIVYNHSFLFSKVTKFDSSYQNYEAYWKEEGRIVRLNAFKQVSCESKSDIL